MVKIKLHGWKFIFPFNGNTNNFLFLTHDDDAGGCFFHPTLKKTSYRKIS